MGFQVTNYLRHPHLGTKGDMRWCCPLLGFYSRVRIGSYKGHFNGKADKLLKKKLSTVSMYFLVIGGHIVLDLHMILTRKNNHFNEFSVLKLVEN